VRDDIDEDLRIHVPKSTPFSLRQPTVASGICSLALRFICKDCLGLRHGNWNR
jgi:hypothetical protein